MNRVFETIFDSYQVQEVVGEGGSGRVFKVVSSDEQVYAVKCLDADKVTRQKLKRFKNELYFCLRNAHANIIQVHDYGITIFKGKECPFYVMNYYPTTLRDLMKKGIAHKKIPQYFSQVLEAMEVAHQQGVWHRDLKPENILHDSSSDRLIVTDFGIAHFCEEFLQTSIETGPQDRLANFQYAAPEQRAKGRSVDQRADVYALGLMVNEMFTGEIPQGVGYKTIESIAPDFIYLDRLVDWMIHQLPDERPLLDAVRQKLIEGSLAAHQPVEVASLHYEKQTTEETVLSSVVEERVQATWDKEWLKRNHAVAIAGLEEMEFPGSMEVWFTLSNHKPNALQAELLAAAKRAQIHKFGWPIGIVLDTPEYKPRPKADGIVAQVAVKDFPWGEDYIDFYDYWALRTNGDFYLLKNMFEDQTGEGNALFFDTRIARIAETLLYCTRLYSHLGVKSTTSIHIMIKHSGLKQRILRTASTKRASLRNRICIENEVEREHQMTLASIEADLVNAVKQFAQPLFILFDFLELHDSVYREVITEQFATWLK